MRHTVRWVYRGRIHETATETRDTAQVVMSAIAAFYSGDGILIQIWNGATVLEGVKS